MLHSSISPCTDTKRTPAHQHAYAPTVVALRSSADGRHDTSDDHQTDSSACRAHPSTACRTPRKYNSPHGSPCPWRRHEPFLRCPRRALYLPKCKKTNIRIQQIVCHQKPLCVTFATASALWSKHAVIVVHAIDLIIHVYGERDPVQALVAYATTKTTRMIRFAHRLQYHLHDEVAADGTFLGSLLETGILVETQTRNKAISLFTFSLQSQNTTNTHHVVLLAVNLSVHIVKCLSAQCPTARTTDKAVRVIQIAHGLACLTGARHLFAARMTDAKVFALLFAALHLLLQLAR